jgi:hypothetical protein
VQGYNISCARHTQLADGRLLVAGGNKNAAMDGIVQTHIFDWRTVAWSRGPDMAAACWYPALAALGYNEAVIVGDGPTVSEVYQTDGTLRRLSNASGWDDRFNAFLTIRPNRQVEVLGPPSPVNTISPSGSGAITAARDRDNISRDYGSFATYDIGKVLVAGGRDARRREGVVAREAFDQNTSGVRGSAENNDSFGQVLDSVRAGSRTQLEVGVARGHWNCGRRRQGPAFLLQWHHRDAGR